MDYWKFFLLSIICYILWICSLCMSQSTTICNDNTEITLFASKNKSYIESYNFPDDYNNTNGDCKIIIFTNITKKSYIRLRIENYIRRNPGTPLMIMKGGKQYLTSKNLKIGKKYDSMYNKLDMNHWSFGSTNDAFRISYESTEKDKKHEDEENNVWIAGPIVGCVVFFVFVMRCCGSAKGGQNNRPGPSNSQPPPPQPAAPPAPTPNTNPNPTGTTHSLPEGYVEHVAPNAAQNNVINRDAPPSYEEAINFPLADKSGITSIQVHPRPPSYDHIIGNTNAGGNVDNSPQTVSNIQTTEEDPYAPNIDSDSMYSISNCSQFAEETLYPRREGSDIISENLELDVVDTNNVEDLTLEYDEAHQNSTSRTNLV